MRKRNPPRHGSQKRSALANRRAWFQQTWGLILCAIFILIFLLVRFGRSTNWHWR